MQLNYLGRYRSLKTFAELFGSSVVANNVIFGRLTDNWTGDIATFDPSKDILTNDSGISDGVTAGSKCDSVTATALLVASAQPVNFSGTVTQIDYNGSIYYGIPVTEANATTVYTASGERFLNLYVEFKFKVNGTDHTSFSFRQIGFRDTALVGNTMRVFCYENVYTQTVTTGMGADDGLTLKLVFAF